MGQTKEKFCGRKGRTDSYCGGAEGLDPRTLVDNKEVKEETGVSKGALGVR